MYIGGKSCSPGKPSHSTGFEQLNLITFVENGKLHFQLKISEFEPNSESESLSNICQLAFLPNIHVSKNGSCNSNLEIRVTWKFGMLSMVYRKKFTLAKPIFMDGNIMSFQYDGVQ